VSEGNDRERAFLKEIESLRQRVRELERFGDGRENAAEALRKEEFFFDLFSATEEVAFLMDREGIILVANENAARLYGIPVERLSGKSIFDLVPRDRVENSKRKVKAVLKTQKTVRFEGKLSGKIFENSLYPVLHDGVEVRRIAVYVRDITERKRLEAILHQTEEKYRNIYENAMEGIFQISPDGYFVSANPSLARVQGYDSPEDLIGASDSVPSRFVNPDDHTRLMNRLFEEGSVLNYEAQMYRKDGSLHWISINVRVVKDDQGKVLYYEGTMRDITKRKRAEEALSESEERYRAAIEHSNDAVALIQGDKTQYVNRKFVEIFGYDRLEEVIGKPIFIIVHPDHQDRVRTINQRRQRGQPVPRRYEFKGITKAGKIIFIEVSATSIVYRGTPVYLIYLRDMTERIQAHEALMQSHQELERLNRAKTKAVHHISHELKTPLAVIQGNIRILKRKLQGLPVEVKLQNILESLERNLGRLFDISKETSEIFTISQELEAGGLLDNLDRVWERIEDLSQIPPAVQSHLDGVKTWLGRYLSGNTEAFQSIDLFPFLLQGLEKIKASSSHRRIRFEADGEEGLFIFMDPLILENVLEGLIRNAVENTPDGGTIHLGVERKHDKIQLHVTDHGVGIREEDQAYIFDGLFHTKETDLYASKKPYDFGAGGKGLDLLRMRVYGQRFGFDLSVTGERCPHIPTDQDECPGDVTRCPHVSGEEECARSGGTTFTVSFPPKESVPAPAQALPASD